jgi:hypothetical protein
MTFLSYKVVVCHKWQLASHNGTWNQHTDFKQLNGFKLEVEHSHCSTMALTRLIYQSEFHR